MGKKWIKATIDQMPPLEDSGDSALYLCKETKKGVPFVGFYCARYRGWIVYHYLAVTRPVVVTHYKELKCLN